MAERLRIAVTGLAATHPFGGVFWDYLQWPLGFHRLGHDVLYVEDTGRWCYDPVRRTFVEDGAANARHLARNVARLGPELVDRWFYRDATGAVFGRPWHEVAEFCRSADVFVHVSASCWMRDEYFAADRVVFVDSDPMYTHASVPAYVDGSLDDDARARVDMLREHDAFFTFAENVGAEDSLVPTDLFDWIPTRQPIVLDHFVPTTPESRRPVLTTVASWARHEDAILVGDREYRGKSPEFERFLDLPGRMPLPMEIALSGDAPASRLRAAGWRIRDGHEVSGDPWTYRDYLARSTAEWSVAKHAYVASRSGWFSCRSACYLALGVPVVVQDTGFSRVLPTGEGLFAFSTAEQAAAGAEAILAEPRRHARAARELAETYFDSGTVLTQLLARATSVEPVLGARGT